VDTDGKGVERLTETAVVANGRAYEVDCLIFATGFEVGTSYARRAGYEIHGRDGATLTEHWRDGLRTMHGLTVHGFPNLFFMGFNQSALTVSVPHALKEQAGHITYVVDEVKARGAQVAEPSAAAEADYVAEVISMSRLSDKFLPRVHAGLLQQRGRGPEPQGVPVRSLRRGTGAVLRQAEGVAGRG